MQKIKSILLSPFIDYVVVFTTYFVLTAITSSLFYFHNENYNYAIMIICVSALISYILTIINRLTISLKYIRPIISYLILFGVFTTSALSIFSYIYHQSNFSGEFLAIFAGTNIQEIKEFLSSLSNGDLIISLLLLIIIIIAPIILTFTFKFLIIKIDNKQLKKIILSTLTTPIIIGAYYTFRTPPILEDSFIGHLFKFSHIIPAPNLNEYLSHPQIIQKGDLPENIVIIIGESFTKSHSSLYNYDKNTNPKLSSLRDSNLLFIFNDAIAPYTHTIECFKSIMSTYRRVYSDSINWYQCTSLQESINTIGYYTYWFSNQSKKGIFDNIPSRYADLCNEKHFAGNKFSGMTKSRSKSYDGYLIDMIKTKLGNINSNNNCYFIHLMGQHTNFEDRYPSSFGKFTPKDYPNARPEQRTTLAHYDNATLYNDSIVYEIMQLFRNNESLIFYFPDHGIDLYESQPTRAQHANPMDETSSLIGRKIPFIIYTSQKYQLSYPNKISLFEEAINENIYTEDFIYMLMDILDVKFQHNHIPSIFQNTTNKFHKY